MDLQQFSDQHDHLASDVPSLKRAIANKETILLTLSDTGVLGAGATKLGADLRSAIAATR